MVSSPLSPSVQCLENNMVEGVWSGEDQGPPQSGILVEETGEEKNYIQKYIQFDTYLTAYQL